MNSAEIKFSKRSSCNGLLRVTDGNNAQNPEFFRNIQGFFHIGFAWFLLAVSTTADLYPTASKSQ